MATAKKAPAKKAPAKKAATKKVVAKKAPAKKVVAKNAPAKKAPAKKVVAKKPAAKKAVPAKKPAAKKPAAKKVAAKKPVAKKAKAPAKKRTPNAAFMKAMTPSSALAAVIGSTPCPRTEVVSKLWTYIKKNGLQDKVNKRNINADDKLKAIFGKSQVTMFELAGLIGKHLS
jgi:chromatin remodeling complex protein RSC6